MLRFFQEWQNAFFQHGHIIGAGENIDVGREITAIFINVNVLVDKQLIYIAPFKFLSGDKTGAIPRRFGVVKNTRHGKQLTFRINALQTH